MHNFVPNNLSSLSEKELMAYYDNPYNFPLGDCREIAEELDEFPSHVMCFLTHGVFSVNSEIRRKVEETVGGTKKQVNRLLRNYSDWATTKIMKRSGIPKSHIIRPDTPRLVGDPARAHYEGGHLYEEFIRGTDFNEQKLLENPSEYRDIGQKSAQKFHHNITQNLVNIENVYGGSIGFDVHDSGNIKMHINPKLDSFRLGGLPPVILGTRDGAACNPEILDYFAERIEYYLGIKAHKNVKYKGGYVTKKHGEDYRKNLEQKGENPGKRNIIQIELARYLYMQESTQKLDWHRVDMISAGLKLAMIDTGNKFGKEYFEGLQ
ncbi:N-formylglutamate amidohydrolase [Candidatus Gracilibacteria bacterium]|nr:N-formylglutamate amidohydrolase [Candidatus Gracilibacteria bacterium]